MIDTPGQNVTPLLKMVEDSASGTTVSAARPRTCSSRSAGVVVRPGQAQVGWLLQSLVAEHHGRPSSGARHCEHVAHRPVTAPPTMGDAGVGGRTARRNQGSLAPEHGTTHSSRPQSSGRLSWLAHAVRNQHNPAASCDQHGRRIQLAGQGEGEAMHYIRIRDDADPAEVHAAIAQLRVKRRACHVAQVRQEIDEDIDDLLDLLTAPA